MVMELEEVGVDGVRRVITIPTFTTATEKFLWDKIEKLEARVKELVVRLESVVDLVDRVAKLEDWVESDRAGGEGVL